MTTTIEALQWEEATAAVRAAERILVVTHIKPDGDAIGSMLGLVNAFRALGKSVDCAVDEGLPFEFGFLPGSETVQAALESGAWDLMISSDSSDEARTGLVGLYGRANSKQVINLDHHQTNMRFGDIHLIDAAAVSAAEVAYRWLVHMDLPLTRDVAIPLLTGMITDTIGFRTSNVTAQTLVIAHRLISAGASLTEITARTLDNRSFETVKLWRQAFNNVSMQPGGVVTAQLSRTDFESAGLDDDSDFGLVGFLININEAMIAAVFKETDEGEINISMRAKPGFDVSGVAFELGGGGHRQAAGATVNGSLTAVRDRVLPLLEDAARRGKLNIV
ncbi:MAG: DHH family phosphoesterase [Chloroflexota bacterium]